MLPRSSVSIFRTNESRCFSGPWFDSFFFNSLFLQLYQNTGSRECCLIKYANIFIFLTRLHGCWLIVMDGLSLSNWKSESRELQVTPRRWGSDFKLNFWASKAAIEMRNDESIKFGEKSSEARQSHPVESISIFRCDCSNYELSWWEWASLTGMQTLDVNCADIFTEENFSQCGKWNFIALSSENSWNFSQVYRSHQDFLSYLKEKHGMQPMGAETERVKTHWKCCFIYIWKIPRNCLTFPLSFYIFIFIHCIYKLNCATSC